LLTSLISFSTAFEVKFLSATGGRLLSTLFSASTDDGANANIHANADAAIQWFFFIDLMY
jgi:hypothetical protein